MQKPASKQVIPIFFGVCICGLLGFYYFGVDLAPSYVVQLSFNDYNHTETRPGNLTCQQEYDSFTLDTRHGFQSDTHDETTVCQRKKINPTDACRYVQKVFDEASDKCKQYQKAELCVVKKVANSRTEENMFNCSFARNYCSHAWIGILSNATSTFVWLDLDIGHIESKLQFVSYGLTYLLKCQVNNHFKQKFNSSNEKRYQMTADGTLMQAFWFFKEPGKLSKFSERNMERPNKPSISILFTDTVSRTLAFRGLPKTVKFLSRLKKNSKRPVLDFKLFQSISLNTNWNIFNLFDGPNANRSYVDDIFYIKKGSTFFRKFKQEGYLTAYYSDICHTHVWTGTDLGDIGQWRKFVAISEELQLDNIGVAEITCEIFRPYYGPFSGYQKCINGRQNVVHQLDHLTDLQNFWFSRGRNFMTFWETNINHNPHVHHISFLDEYLEKYLRNVLAQPELMVIIFSDHSTRHGKYINEQAPESLTDRFHPYLFIILPENAASYISKSELRALELNQNRLLSTRDLHFLFSKFWNNQRNASSSDAKETDPPDRGILSEISPLRTCKDLKYMKGSVHLSCICELNLTTLSSGEVTNMTQFVQHELNGLIADLLNKTEIGQRNCEKLVLRPAALKPFQRYHFDKDYSHIAGSFVMDNYPFDNEPVGFWTEVSEERGILELLSFHRTDTYSRFDHCTPAPFRDRKLCICGNKTNKGF